MDNYYLHSPNPISNFNFNLPKTSDSSSDLEFPDYLSCEAGLDQFLCPQTTNYSQNNIAIGSNLPVLEDANSTHTNMKSEDGIKINEEDGRTSRIAIRTKTELEIMDDGFKWKKYGKKMVKNSLNPRNYYKCSSEGCKVKKRVERDGKDISYVITTYDGIHNHQSPSIAYYTTTANDLPNSWSLQSCYSSSHSSP